ncbi:MAG TPA: hypothetical protein PK024_04620 [Methanospirillum sp.]|uniref:hypothetical protein n=1 Tax=Methanospirillum sp. TaxID=45200 RepID=UPI002CB3D4C7|nr:hypothetical protein [Methanospirillum sp.]HOJ96108.1 hypothetical protein [Methanospirillum sp.]
MVSKIIHELSPNERLAYTKTVLRIRQDPIWFMKEILGWKGMWPKQEEIIRTFYQHKYNPSLPEYKELAWISGQRSGKSVVVGHIAAYEFHEIISLDDPAGYYHLMKKQPLAVTCIAAGKDQALDGIFSLMQTALEESEWINHHYDLTFHSDGRIDSYYNKCFAQVKAARADTAAGYTSKAVLFDELDLFQNNTTSKLAAENVFRKLVNSTMTLGNAGKIISISSLDYTNGMMARVYYDATQKPNALAYKYCTWEVNPNPEVSEERLREEYKYNMEAFWKYFANRPDVSSTMMFPGGVRLNHTIPNLLKTDIISLDTEVKDIPRVIAIDPAVKNDSFGMAFGWRRGDYIRIDGVTKYEKPGEKDAFIKPSDIKNIISLILDEMNIIGFIHDTYQYPEILEMVEYDYGLQPIQHHADAEAYGKWFEIQEGASPLNLDITYDEHLRRECEQLTKERLPSGKIRIDHPPRGGKDSADPVANCIWYLDANMQDLYGSFKPVGMIGII